MNVPPKAELAIAELSPYLSSSKLENAIQKVDFDQIVLQLDGHEVENYMEVNGSVNLDHIVQSVGGQKGENNNMIVEGNSVNLDQIILGNEAVKVVQKLRLDPESPEMLSVS